VALLGVGSPTEPSAVVRLDLDTRRIEVLRSETAVTIDRGYLSIPQPIEFPTDADRTAYAIYYAPKNRDCAAPAGERPPLLVMSHGGPTGAARSALNLAVQYWTSRGIAVVDVNYGGSTGYGRAYRERLNGEWGIVDMNDCANAALHLVRQGLADPARLAITGSSAGGYTTLCVLTFRSEFRAGASHFGVSDLEALASDTHKFESRYLDRLVGPYPERRELYRARSPINHAERLSCPLILFQGLEDKVVPPEQSRRMFEAARAKGLPVAYLAFEGEQHGFRQAASIKRALDGELYFYSRIFGFALADPVEPVAIENLR
jgi:dipeptidyl aminopeptidase/acylaminoacyl peptidase